jgi:hypothetical protein
MINQLKIKGWLNAARTAHALLFGVLMIGTFTPNVLLFGAEDVESLNLHQAIKQGYLRADAISTGGSSAHCLSLTLKSLHNRSIEVRVTPGTLMTASDHQDILITREEVLVLQPHQSMKRDLYGFCTQPSEATPEENTAFKITEGSPVWQELAALLQKENLNASAEQSVVWACTDEYPLSGVRLARGNRTELTALIERERGAEIPFYETDYGDILNRPFERELLEVKGAMVHHTNKTGAASLKVYDPEGNMVYDIFEGKQLHSDATYTFRFRIMGTYLPEGEYKMVLTIGTEEARVERIVV